MLRNILLDTPILIHFLRGRAKATITNNKDSDA